ncbi:hypothetical protein ACJIZ3_024216 [Penstemon smallii]|uniref:Uncharacterized protein n=1 Tax=Penstemon smallii TaxID=265156 RepID=A0ABD3TS80_9LAMI
MQNETKRENIFVYVCPFFNSTLIFLSILPFFFLGESSSISSEKVSFSIPRLQPWILLALLPTELQAGRIRILHAPPLPDQTAMLYLVLEIFYATLGLELPQNQKAPSVPSEHPRVSRTWLRAVSEIPRLLAVPSFSMTQMNSTGPSPSSVPLGVGRVELLIQKLDLVFSSGVLQDKEILET